MVQRLARQVLSLQIGVQFSVALRSSDQVGLTQSPVPPTGVRKPGLSEWPQETTSSGVAVSITVGVSILVGHQDAFPRA